MNEFQFPCQLCPYGTNAKLWHVASSGHYNRVPRPSTGCNRSRPLLRDLLRPALRCQRTVIPTKSHWRGFSTGLRLFTSKRGALKRLETKVPDATDCDHLQPFFFFFQCRSRPVSNGRSHYLSAGRDHNFSAGRDRSRTVAATT